MKNFCKKLFFLTFASMTTVCAERVLQIVEVDQDLIRLENGSFISISSDGGHNLEVEDLLEFEDSSFDAMMNHDCFFPEGPIEAYSEKLDTMFQALSKGYLIEKEKIKLEMPILVDEEFMGDLHPMVSNMVGGLDDLEAWEIKIIILESNDFGLCFLPKGNHSTLDKRFVQSKYYSQLWDDEREGYFSDSSGMWVHLGTIIEGSTIEGTASGIYEDTIEISTLDNGRKVPQDNISLEDDKTKISLKFTKFEELENREVHHNLDDQILYFECDFIDYDPLIGLFEDAFNQVSEMLPSEDEEEEEGVLDFSFIKSDMRQIKSFIYNKRVKDIMCVDRI